MVCEEGEDEDLGLGRASNGLSKKTDALAHARSAGFLLLRLLGGEELAIGDDEFLWTL